jgi:dienelactone hydrolase
MKTALERANKPYELVIFPGAVHMFEREPQFHPPGNRTRFGTVTGHDPSAARESWQKTVDWLRRHLPSPPG